MSYQGRYQPIHPEKYKGNPTNIVYRSSWERLVMKWCDTNPDVLEWNSEEIIIGYICATDGQAHRYFPDFFIKFKSGLKLLVEVKPEVQTAIPKNSKNTKRALVEAFTFAKNKSKWEAAKQYASKNDMIFQVWTEKTLRNMGIMIKGKK